MTTIRNKSFNYLSDRWDSRVLNTGKIICDKTRRVYGSRQDHVTVSTPIIVVKPLTTRVTDAHHVCFLHLRLWLTFDLLIEVTRSTLGLQGSVSDKLQGSVRFYWQPYFILTANNCYERLPSKFKGKLSKKGL